MGLTTDKTLLERLRGGEGIYWDEFYRKYYSFLLHIAREYGFGPDDSEDLIQRTLLNLFKGCEHFEYSPERGKFRNYLWSIVKHEASSIRAKPNFQIPSGIHFDVIDSTIEEKYDELWRQSLFDEGMEILKNLVEQTTFEAFYMNAVQNRPVAEVARALGLSVSYIYVAKKRCVEKLHVICQELLDKEG